MPDPDRALPLVIAHRGASGYLPEHTLEAKALAVGLGARHLEQDVALSRDGTPVVIHDLSLDATTDVAEKFAGRQRPDGKHYVADFDMDELRQLAVGERINSDGSPVFAARYPAGLRPFRLSTLGEELDLVRGLEKSTGRTLGVFVELKHPAWHRHAGMNLAGAVLEVLDQAGYLGARNPAWLQCFNPRELARIRAEAGNALPLVQLMRQRYRCDDEYPFRWPVADSFLERIASHASAIGASLAMLLAKPEAGQSGSLGATARALGLKVFAFTVRTDQLPAEFESLKDLVAALTADVGVDGIFTDFPDLVAAQLSEQATTAT